MTSYTTNALDQLQSLSEGGGTTTFSYNSAGEMTSQLMPGYLVRSDSKSGSVNTSGTASQSWTVSATAGGALTGQLDWEKTTRSFSHLGVEMGAAGISPATSNKTVEASAPGTINATLSWLAIRNLDLRLLNPSGTEVACSCNLTGQSESISYNVPSGFTGTYTLQVVNHTPLNATYDLTGDSQVYAGMKLELFNPSNSLVATASSASANRRTLSYTVPSGSTGTYTYKVTALTDQASYTLAQSFPVENKQTYSYSEAGLPASEDTNLQRVTWKLDGLGRVIGATMQDWKGAVSSDLRYGYGGSSDARITETPVGSSTPSAGYISDPEGLLVSKVGSSVTYGYYSAHGDLVQSGSPSAVLTYVTPAVYDEFGNPARDVTPFGWTGRQQRATSTLTGVIRMGARLYSPALGRFLSRDPMPGGSANDYDYARQDPVNGFDLDGHWPSFLGSIGRAITGAGRWIAQRVTRDAIAWFAGSVLIGIGLRWAVMGLLGLSGPAGWVFVAAWMSASVLGGQIVQNRGTSGRRGKEPLLCNSRRRWVC